MRFYKEFNIRSKQSLPVRAGFVFFKPIFEN